jgi:hypothetical protein
MMRIRHAARLPVFAPTVVVAMLGGAIAASAAAAQDLQSTASDGVAERTSSTEKSRPVRPEVDDVAARVVLAIWLRAQLRGDFDTYAKLHDDGFQGTKRVCTRSHINRARHRGDR